MLKLLAAACLSSLAILASASDNSKRVILGFLGETTRATKIYATPSTHARVFSRVSADHYLIINPGPKEGWFSVLLTNATSGYVQTSTVKQLPFEVPAKNVTETRFGSSGGELGDLASRSSVARNALGYLGTPYKWGGTDARNGIDCSGFVQKMYGQIGFNLPRTAAEQVKVGERVLRLEDLQPGDRLYFWDSKRGMIGHTGIYIGNGMFVHSSHGNKGVATDTLSTRWQRILVAARR